MCVTNYIFVSRAIYMRNEPYIRVNYIYMSRNMYLSHELYDVSRTIHMRHNPHIYVMLHISVA